MFHRAMELLARKKLAEQNGQTEFWDNETKNNINIKDITRESIVEFGFNHYKQKTPHIKWYPKHKKQLTEWVNQTLASEYSPLKLKIIAAEKFFDIEVPYDWASYEFFVQGKKVQGQLRIRGTVDLLFESAPNILSALDWKTGGRINWKTKEEKDVPALYRDNQLLLYYYALKHTFPSYENVEMNICYVKEGAGGWFPLHYGENELRLAETLIKDTFLAIKNDNKPSWIFYDSHKNFHCKFCSFNKENHSSGKTLCKHYHDQIVQIGLDKIINSELDLKKFGHYTGGGTERQVEQAT